MCLEVRLAILEVVVSIRGLHGDPEGFEKVYEGWR